MKFSDYDKRMKKYEYVTRTYLYTRTPVIIRIDGKAFHSFTRGFVKPFDSVLVRAMQDTMEYLCKNIQGCVLGYTQSDEISLLLTDFQTLTTSAWFDYNIQKCASIASSMASMIFNRFFTQYANSDMSGDGALSGVYEKALTKGAVFDARVFNLPKEEVCNYFLWRQNDAVRNSIQMTGHCYFSAKELHKKSCDDIKEMLISEKGIDWNTFPTTHRRGSCCIKAYDEKKDKHVWTIDNDIPIFRGNDRAYVNDLLLTEEERNLTKAIHEAEAGVGLSPAFNNASDAINCIINDD